MPTFVEKKCQELGRAVSEVHNGVTTRSYRCLNPTKAHPFPSQALTSRPDWEMVLEIRYSEIKSCWFQETRYIRAGWPNTCALLPCSEAQDFACTGDTSTFYILSIFPQLPMEKPRASHMCARRECEQPWWPKFKRLQVSTMK